MDLYAKAQEWMWAVPCDICDTEFSASDGPVLGEYERDDDGTSRVRVRHTWCDDAVQTAKADAYRDAANLAAHNGAPEAVVLGLRMRARAAQRATERDAAAQELSVQNAVTAATTGPRGEWRRH